MLNKFKIGTKLIAFFLIVGIVPLAFMGIKAYTVASSALKAEAENKLDAVALLKKAQIETMFDNLRANMQAISQTNDIKNSIAELVKYHREMHIQPTALYDMSSSDPDVTVKYEELYKRVNALLRVYPEQYGYYDIFLICAPHGHVMYTWAKESDLGTNLSAGPYRDTELAAIWKGVNAGKAFVITDTKPYAPSNGAPALFTGAPIKDEAGNILGVIAVQISQEDIDKITQEATGMGATGETYLVGPDYLFRTNSRLTKTSTLLKSKAETKGVKEAFKSKSEFDGVYGDYTTQAEAKAQNRSYSTALGGVPVVGMTAYIPALNWVIVTEVDEEEAYAAATSLRNTMLLTIFISIILIVVSAYFISRTITNPINKVVVMLKDIATGDGDLTMRLNVAARDEVGELASWFNTFVGKLQEIMIKIKASSDQVGNAAEQISAASEQLATGAEEQQYQLSEVSTATEEMSAMILESSKSTGATQQSANSADASAQEGREAVIQALHGMAEITRLVKEAGLKIGALESRSDEIGEVIQVIDDIADQTNLLALNANIEAARAGDAGRGFAVVADEVRKLAERTVSATGEIGKKIGQIQKDVADSVKSMGETGKQADENQQLAAQSQEALEKIVRAIAEVNSAITQIAAAAEQQSSGAEEISKNVEGVSSVSKQAAAASQELASSAEELSREVKGLNDLINQFKV